MSLCFIIALSSNNCLHLRLAVGRVEWNITGSATFLVSSHVLLIFIFVTRTILSSAGNDGYVRLWKQTIGGVWRPAGQISLQQATERSKETDDDADESVIS